MAASDDEIQEILRQVAAENLSPAEPVITRVFDFGDPLRAQRVVEFHRWVTARIGFVDFPALIRFIARRVVIEMRQTSLSLVREVLFGPTYLMPSHLLWSDGSPLFSRIGEIDGEHRFGVEGGNTVESVGCHIGDVENAVDRLIQLDQRGAYDSDVPLMVVCARRLERHLIRACARAGQKCKVVGLRDYDHPDWVVLGAKSPCAMEITKPDFTPKNIGAGIIVGARFSVWMTDPTQAIFVRSKEIS